MRRRSFVVSLCLILSAASTARAADDSCADNWTLNAYFAAAEKQAIVDGYAQGDETFRNALADLFQSKKDAIRTKLTLASSRFEPINDDGLALVFSGVLAYELWS